MIRARRAATAAGLPADVIPLELPAIAAFGHAEMLAALASGFAEVASCPRRAPSATRSRREIALAGALAGAAPARSGCA